MQVKEIKHPLRLKLQKPLSVIEIQKIIESIKMLMFDKKEII